MLAGEITHRKTCSKEVAELVTLEEDLRLGVAVLQRG